MGLKMKKNIFFTVVVILLISLLTLVITENCMSQWIQCSSGLEAGTVHALAVSGNNIFAGTQGLGIYLSTNNGQNWTHTALNNKNISSLAVSGNYIFAGIWNSSGVYLSTNNGTTWTQTMLNNKSVESLVVSGNNIFAGTTSYGVYLSTNNGQTWDQTALNSLSVCCLAVSGNNIFAGTGFGQGVYLSTNNGTTWTQTMLNNKTILSLAVSGNNSEDSGQVIFAGADENGVYLSTNNGTSWTQTALNNKSVHSIAINGNNIFAGVYWSGVYFSTNNGQNWIQKNQGFPSIITVYSLLIANNYIFAGTWGQYAWRRPLAEITGIQNISTKIPAAYFLEQNYPNPFNPSTKIRFAIPKNEIVTLKIFDLLGREVAVLVNEKLQSGIYETDWNASSHPSGVYFYSLNAGDFKQTKRMILVR